MHPLAEELNTIIEDNAPHVYEMLSELGRRLYFPKGILAQTAEAKAKAERFNATIGMATKESHAMFLPSVMSHFQGLSGEELFPYAPATGRPDLREKWREEMLSKNPGLASKSFSTPIVTSGVTHALSLIADLFVDSGDLVVVPDMHWGNYDLLFGVRYQAEIVTHRFFNANGNFDVEAFRALVESKASSGKLLVVILNFPNNPTGYSITPKEADEIAAHLEEVADQGCNVVAVCDDAYFGLLYEEGLLKESIFARLAARHPRLLAIKADGATKEHFVWGFRVGFLTFSAACGHDAEALYGALEKKTAAAIRSAISNCAHPSQSLVLRAMGAETYEQEKATSREILRKRAQKVKEILQAPEFENIWESYPFNSGYFMCLRLKNVDAEAYRQFLLEKYGIGVISVSAHDIRVAFSSVDEKNLPELFNTMAEAARSLAEQDRNQGDT